MNHKFFGVNFLAVFGLLVFFWGVTFIVDSVLVESISIFPVMYFGFLNDLGKFLVGVVVSVVGYLIFNEQKEREAKK